MFFLFLFLITILIVVHVHNFAEPETHEIKSLRENISHCIRADYPSAQSAHITEYSFVAHTHLNRLSAGVQKKVCYWGDWTASYLPASAIGA